MAKLLCPALVIRGMVKLRHWTLGPISSRSWATPKGSKRVCCAVSTFQPSVISMQTEGLTRWLWHCFSCVFAVFWDLMASKNEAKVMEIELTTFRFTPCSLAKNEIKRNQPQHSCQTLLTPQPLTINAFRHNTLTHSVINIKEFSCVMWFILDLN